MNKIEQLKELKALLDANAINKEQYDFLVDEIIKVENNDVTNSELVASPSSTQAAIEQFNSVVIGSNVWMTENLRVKRFRNGDLIPEASTLNQWAAALNNKSPAFCYYEDDPGDEEKYGLLYNYYAVIDKRGLSPKSWRIPRKEDFDSLVISYQNQEQASRNLRCRDLWTRKSDIEDEDKPWGWRPIIQGTNKSGFNARPAGVLYIKSGIEVFENDEDWIERPYFNHKFIGKGFACVFWGISVGDNGEPLANKYCELLFEEDCRVSVQWGDIKKFDDNYYSVRCIKDVEIDKSDDTRITKSDNTSDAISDDTSIAKSDDTSLHDFQLGLPDIFERSIGNDLIIQSIIQKYQGEKIFVLTPLIRAKKGHYHELLNTIRKQGFFKVRIDGKIEELVFKIPLDREKTHDIEVVIDTVEVGNAQKQLLNESINRARKLSKSMKLSERTIMIIEIISGD